MKCLFTGMEWFPECQDGGLDRYFYEQSLALAERGDISATVVVSSCKPNQAGAFKLRPMATRGVSLFRRWAGARAEARRAFSGGVDLVNAHFALYAFPLLNLIPSHVP